MEKKKKTRRQLMREVKALTEEHATLAYLLLGLLIQSDGVLTIEKEDILLIDPEMTFTLSYIHEGRELKISLDIPEDKHGASTDDPDSK